MPQKICTGPAFIYYDNEYSIIIFVFYSSSLELLTKEQVKLNQTQLLMSCFAYLSNRFFFTVPAISFFYYLEKVLFFLI